MKTTEDEAPSPKIETVNTEFRKVKNHTPMDREHTNLKTEEVQMRSKSEGSEKFIPKQTDKSLSLSSSKEPPRIIPRVLGKKPFLPIPPLDLHSQHSRSHIGSEDEDK